MSTTVVMTSDTGPLPRREAWPAVARCVAATAYLLARRRIHQPTEHLGRAVSFADGTSGRVYRETRIDRACPSPCVLLVEFRLRGVRGRGHRAFELESILNTPLFVGFPGFISKWWLAHDQRGVYRGVYEWDGPAAAERYARSLWRVLALVSVKGSIDYRVMPGLRRDELMADPGRIRPGESEESWWQVVRAR